MRSRLDRGFRIALFALLAVALFAARAAASVVIPPSDDELIVRADAVILGRVTDIESHDNRQGKLSTYITFAIDEVLKGSLAQPTLTIRELGGQVAGLGGWVFANPEFTVGEQVLLFLDQRDDGTLRILHFYLGKFSIMADPATGDLVAVRPLPDEVTVIAPSGVGAAAVTLGAVGRGLDELKERIREKAGEPRPLMTRPSTGLQLSSARRPAGGLAERHQEFRFLRDPNPPTPTNPALVQPRFAEPDTNTPVVMRFNTGIEPLAPAGSDGGREQVRAAFRAWSRVPTTSFRWVEGPVTTTQGFNRDFANTVSFRDPDGDISPPSGCSGVLAVGGMFFSTTPSMTVNGRQFSAAVEADLVFADGWDACGVYYQSFANLTEVATHELGHALGLGHSEISTVDPISGLDGATMEAFAHFDGRGATLHADDKAGVTFIYPGRTLTIQKTGGGDGLITSGTAGIDCGTDCVAGFAFNSTVTLTVAPVAGSTFQGYVEAGCGPTVTMSADRTCTATFTTEPDLVISAISGPVVAAPGTTIVLNNTAKNNGLLAGAFNVGIYLGSSAAVTTADRQLTTRRVNSGLATGAVSADATSVQIPSDVTPGNYFLGAIADLDGEVTEANEGNNAGSAAILVAQPDLVVTTLTAPATAGAGQTISVNSTVKNQATAAVSAGASTLAFYLSGDATFDGGDVRLSATRAIGALAKDATSVGTTALTIPATTAAGAYFLIAVADDLAAVAETSEVNNTRTAPIAISRPDLSVTLVTVSPTQAAAGMNVSVTQTVKNVAAAPANAPASASRLTLSNNTTLGDGDDVDLGTVAIPALAAGAQAVVAKNVVLPPGTAPGAYWIFARANDGDVIPEGGLGSANNAAHTAMATTVGPDLIMSTATAAPAALAPGGTVNVTNVVKNLGGPTALAFDVGFYLSTNTTFEAGTDILLATRRVTTALAAGASTPSAITAVGIPGSTPAGTYFVIARADASGTQPNGEVLETNEGNNVRATGAIQVVKADLAVQSVATTPAVIAPGGNVSVTHVVKNLALAPGAAGASTSRLYLSSNPTLEDPGDIVLGDVPVGAVAGGAMATVTRSVQIPGGLAEGQYWIIARANATGTVPEADAAQPDNNVKAAAAAILVGPDLVVSAATASPGTTAPGLTVSVNHTVKNQGGQAAGPFDVSVYLSPNNTFDAGQDLLLSTRRVTLGLAPAATSMAVLPVLIPTNQSAGSYFLLVRADSTGPLPGEVTEANEANNVVALALTIARADLLVTSVTAPAVGAAGANMSVTHVVRNQAPAPGSAPATTSRLYLSTDSTLDGGDVQLGDAAVGPLGAGLMATVTKSVVIPPGTVPGRYFVIAQANATGTVVEADGPPTGNNVRATTTRILIGPDLVVSAATAAPTAMAPGATVNVTSTVKNQGGATAGAGAGTVGIYLSSDNVFDGGDTLLGSRAAPSLAVAAVSGPIVTPVSIPSSLSAGSYFLIVRADSTGAVVEGDETNNGLAVALTVVRPDLTMQSVTATPATITPGANVSVTHVVKNIAAPAGAAATSTSRLYLSTDATLDDPGDTALGDVTVAALGGGAMATVSRSFTIPGGTTPGKYWIIARANATSSVIESDSPTQANDVKATATPIVVGPDLLATAASAVAAATPGMNVSVMYTLKNQGGQAANNFDVGFALVPQPSGADIPIGPTRTGVSMLPGATTPLTSTVAIPAGTALGAYKIKVIADTGGAIIEADEGNNTFLTGVLTVLRPDLTVPTVTFTPALIAPGGNITVTHTVKNVALAPGSAPASTSRLLLSTDQTTGGQVADLGTANVPAIAPAGMATVTRSATVPGGLAPGLYYVLARADDGDAIAEPPTASNLGSSVARLVVGPDLAVTTAATTIGTIPGANVSVTYTLKNLGSAATPFNVGFTLVPVSAGPDIPIGPARTGVVVAAGGTLAGSSVVLVPTSVAAGQYRVRVTADPSDAIVEANETNNAATTGILTITPPELGVSSLTVPGTGIAGRTVGIPNAVRNSATAPGTAPSFQVGLYLATSASIDPGSDTLLASRTVATLAPGATSAATTTVTLPTTAGNYFIGAVADRAGGLTEGNEGNNQQSSAIAVVPDMVRPSRTASVQLTLSNCLVPANNGSVSLPGTFVVPTQTGATWSGTVRASSGPQVNTMTISGTVDIAGAITGTFTLVNSGGARGNGSFSGTVTSNPSGPDPASATFNGSFTVGELCTIAGSFSSP